jgi:hypothetical protein
MNMNHQTPIIQNPARSTQTVTVVKPDIIVQSGLEELDRLLGGFKAGELTLVDGTSSLIAELPHQLCVHTYRTFCSDTVYIDGGMCADPYQIARYARMLELEQHDVLAHVHISRAFTVYQLSTLIQDLLEPLLQKHSPRTLLIGMFPALYNDPDVPRREAQVLLQRDLHKIRELTKTYQLITILTNRDVMPLSTVQGPGKTLFSSVDELIRMKQYDQCTSIELVKKQKKTTVVRFASGQLCLEAFGMVV